MRLLPNMAGLKLGIAKSSNVLYVEESNLIRLAFLQETQICAQKRHASVEKHTAKNNNCHETVCMSPKIGSLAFMSL